MYSIQWSWDVSLLERCPHFRGCCILELGPEDMSDFLNCCLLVGINDLSINFPLILSPQLDDVEGTDDETAEGTDDPDDPDETEL